jgi:uncharacterized repeat protein (TIGR02543 family)
MKLSKICVTICAVVLALGLTPPSSLAANKTFSGPGNFSDITKWTGSTLPAAGDNLVIKDVCTVDNATANLVYGDLTVGSGSSVGTLEWPVGGTATLNVGAITSSQAGSSIDMTNGGTLQVRSSWTMTNMTFTAGTGIVVWNATSAASTLPAITFNNLTILNGTQTATLGGATVVNGNLLLSSGTLAAGSNALSLAGNWTNNATFAAATGTVTFNGTSGQSIGGSSATTFNNLTVNNASGLTLSLNATVNGTLTLTSGAVATGANTLVMGPSGSVVRTNGQVYGNFRKTVPTGASPNISFEVGDGTVYAPIALAFSNVTTSGNLTAHTTPTEHPNIGTSTFNANKTVNRYWTVSNSGAAFGSYDATFNFVPADIDAGVNTSLLHVAQWDGSSWSLPTAGTRTATSTQATGLTSFSDFAVGQIAVFYHIVASAGPNGTISPADTTVVLEETSQAYTITPAAGYHVEDVLVDGVSVGAVTSYTFTNVTANHTIHASFAVNQYSLTVNATNGTVAKNPDQSLYDHGTSVELTATADLGYHFSNWSGDLSGSTNPQNILMDANKSVTAHFAIDTLTITASAGSGGSISPLGAVAVTYGSDQTFTITPDTGFHIDSVLVDGVNEGPITSYTFTNVTANHLIEAYFSVNQYTLSVGVDGNGSVSKDPDQLLYDHGTSVEVTATADPGYHFVEWTGDASGSDNPLTVVMDADKNITAHFAINQYTITATTTTGGTIDPSGAVIVDHGNSQQFSFAPSAGFYFDSLFVDGAYVPDSTSSYTFENVVEDHSIDVKFKAFQYTLSVTVDGNGSVTKDPDQALYDHGTNVELTAVPDLGQHFMGWSGDLSGSTNPEMLLMDGNKSVTAHFAIDTLVITASASSGGTISPSGSIELLYGGSQQFTITPDLGYHTDSVLVDGVNEGVITDYTFENVSANHSISAYFSINMYTLEVQADENGSVSLDPDQPLYAHGTSVELTALPNQGYHLAMWGGDATGSENPLTVVMNANKFITAHFTIDTLTITASAGPNGIISPSGAVQVLYGDSQSFDVTPNTGYHIAEVLVDGVSVGAVASYEFTNVTASHTIEASFAVDTLTISASAGANGSINPVGDVPVTYGSNQSFTITPDAGYHVADVLVDGLSVGAVTNYSFTNVTANHTIAASFAINQYSLTVNATNGSVAKNPDQSLYDHGTNVELTATANTGYHFTGWSGDLSGTTNPETILMDGNKSVTANFAINQYTITASAGSGGNISPSGAVTVDHGSNQSFTISANSGYHIDSVVVDGVNEGAITNYTFTVVTENHSIEAFFSINQYTLTVGVNGNGSVVKDPDQVLYDHGTSVELTAVPGSGNSFANWTGDASGSTNPLTVVMDGNKSITAHFAEIIYSITASAGPNGSINPSGTVNIAEGSNQTFTFAAASNYHLDSLIVDGAMVTDSTSSYTFVNVTANHTIRVTFKINQYTITATAGANGSIAPSGAIAVDHGSNQSFTITPDAGYHVADVLVDGLSVGAVTNYSFTNVTANHTIAASFAINQYSLTVNATNGSVAKNPDQSLYDHGTNVELTATANTGYHFTGWSGDLSGTTNPETILMDGNKSVTANFAINQYTITASAGSGGNISPSGAVVVDFGTDQSFTITPNTGFHVADVLVDGSSVGAVAAYQFTNVTANHTISASFAIDTLTITASAIGSGQISPAGTIQVTYGTDQSFTMTPNSGSHVDSVVVDGVNLGALTNYQFTGITASHTITAYFSVNRYTLTVNASNGTVTKNPDQPDYAHGTAVELTAVPNAGYHFTGWSGDLVGTNNPDTLTMDGDKSVTASFAINVYTITASAGANGTISPSGTVSINYGASQRFTFTPNANYAVDSLWVNGAYVADSTSGYTFENVTADGTIHVTFKFVTGVGPDDFVPTEYALYQNYPNPFNPSTQIRVDLPEAARVTLVVYNILGREIARLFDDASMGAGVHPVTFRAENLPSGVYFYRLSAVSSSDASKSYTQIKRMSLVK